MGELLGTVTRTRGAPFLDMNGTRPGDSTPQSLNGFEARKAGGPTIGVFPTITEARRAVESAVGGGLLSWSQAGQDNPNRVERYEARSRLIYPGDLRGQLEGGLWLRGDQGVRQQGPAVAGQARWAPRWSSFDGSRNTAATQSSDADKPTFSADGFSGQATLQFAAGDTEFLDTNLIGAIPPPFSVFAAARWLDAGREQVVVQSDGEFVIRVSAARRWQVVSGATTLDAGAADAGQPELISVLQGATSFEAFRNGVSVGTGPTAPVAGEWRISDPASAWHRDIAEVLVVPTLLNQRVHESLVRSYFAKRYFELPI